MNVRRFVLLAASIALISTGLSSSNASLAQEPAPLADDAIDRVRLFDSLEPAPVASSQSNIRRTQMSVSELRQARALYRANQRVARLEYNLWMGHEPLRPKWNSVPMMSSRYSNRRIYIPVYVRP